MAARKPSRTAPAQERPAAPDVTLFQEDWRELKPGPISAFRSAFGEYHTHPKPPGGGAWGDAVLSTGQTGLSWRVATDGDEPCFEACQQMDHRAAILVLDRVGELSEYSFTVPVRPLSSKRPCGLVFHYQNNRTYFALLWSGRGKLSLVRTQHGASSTLASAELPFDVDNYHQIRVSVAGRKATVSVDGRELIQAAMPPIVTGLLDGPRDAGKVGLLAHSPARFKAPRVTASPAAAKRRQARLDAAQRELASLREANPRPEVISECRLHDFGAGRSLRIADIDGDGELEYVIAHASSRANQGDYQMISCVTAFKANGQVLWQIGRPVKPAELADAPTQDLCYQVADIDGDGKLELILCRDWQIQVYDARTAKLLRACPTPRSTLGQSVIGWAVEDYYDRICGDSLHLCDLSGRGKCGEFLIKDRYCNLWAYDSKTLKELWHVVLNTGHYPLAFDINGDGRDEVMCGFSLISHDGKLIWQGRYGDHVDGIGVGHFDPARQDYQIVWVAGEEGVFIVGQDGRVIANHVTGHVQKMSIGNFLPPALARAGVHTPVQIATITYWGNQGIFSVYDGRGVKLHESEPWHLASAITPVGWRGDGSDFMLLSTHPEHGGMLDGRGRRVVMFPRGYPHLACDAVDIDGCGREEILSWDFDRFVIFKAAGQPLGKIPPRYTGPLYNRSNYKANVSLPMEVIAPSGRRGAGHRKK